MNNESSMTITLELAGLAELSAAKPQYLGGATFEDFSKLAVKFALESVPMGLSSKQLVSLIEQKLDQSLEPKARVERVQLTSKMGWIKQKLEGYSPQNLSGLPDWADYLFFDGEKGLPGGIEAYQAQFKACLAHAGLEAHLGQICGKLDQAMYPGEGAVKFNLGEAHWRLPDFIRADSIQTLHLKLKGCKPMKSQALGDGVIAICSPESLGLPAGTCDLLQVRGFVFTAEGEVSWLMKGLLEVNPGTLVNKLAFDDGYGVKSAVDFDAHSLQIEVMKRASEYNPQGSVSMQAGYYEGRDGWETQLSPQAIVKTLDDSDSGKLLLADMPILHLPIDALISLGRGVLSSLVTIKSGQRRMAYPDLDLKAHTFKAPRSLETVFALNRKYTIHRDPAMPDGSSAFTAVCVGYTPLNAFLMPSSQWQETGDLEGLWEQAGGDFDGDDAVVHPHISDGGLLMGFDDYSPAIQAQIKAKTTLGRKADKVEYATRLLRWMEGNRAAIELGYLDTRCRKQMDLGLSRVDAAAFKPLIQVAVDRQKRDVSYPAGSELRIMGATWGGRDICPKFEWLEGGAETLTAILKSIKRPELESPDKTSWQHGYKLMASMFKTAEGLAAHVGINGQPSLLEAVVPMSAVGRSSVGANQENPQLEDAAGPGSR